MVKPEQLRRLQEADASKIFAAIVALYGERVANDVADAILKGMDTSHVVWPRF